MRRFNLRVSMTQIGDFKIEITLQAKLILYIDLCLHKSIFKTIFLHFDVI